MKFLDKSEIANLKIVYPRGTRVKLIFMDDIQAPPSGTEGTVKYIDDAGLMHVNWDTGSSLAVVVGEDKIQKI